MTAQSQAGQDTAVWLATNPLEAPAGSYPKLFYNINLPPILVRDAEQAAKLGDAWRPIDVVADSGTAIVSLTPPADSVGAVTETTTFHVTVTGAGTWTAATAASWITIVSPTDPQSVDGDVTYSVTDNTGAERIGDITVNGKTFAVTQAAGA